MPIYRLNTSGVFKKITGVYRLNNSGVLKKISNAYRLNDSGTFKRIFASLLTPSVKTATRPLLYFRDGGGYETASSEIFSATSSTLTSPAAYDGDKIFLIRGNWNEEPISFFMRIQKSQSAGFSSGVTNVNSSSSVTRTYSSYSDSNYADEVPLSSTNRYTITKADVRDGYYFRGYIEATNNLDRTGEYSTEVVLPRMYANVVFNQATIGSYVGDPQTNGGTFYWSYSGNSTIQAQDISEQQFLVYPYNNTSASPLYSTTIFPGTGTSSPNTTVTFTSANLSPNTQYTIVIKATMQDGWASNSTVALRTIETDQQSFTTAQATPAIPTNVTATDVGTNRAYNNGAVNLSWTQADNGATIVGYKIEYQQGPNFLTYQTLVSDTGSNTTSGTFTGLLSNTSYKFNVSAIGSLETSNRSEDSNAVLITTVPFAPTGVSAVAGNASADVSFTPPTLTGGKSLIDYRATSAPGGIAGSDTVSPIPVTGLINYTAYTFTVAARNANGYSVESIASNSVTPQLPAPVGSGSVTIASDSASNYIFQITEYGTWSNSATSYDYQWQTSSDGGSNWTTRSSGTEVTTIPNYDAVSQKTQLIRLRVFGRNQTGAAVSPLTSNLLTVFYTSPIITSLTVTGGAGLLIWNFSFTADDPVVTMDLEYKLSSSSTYTPITNPSTSGQQIVAAGTYDFRVFIFNSVNGGFRSDVETVTNIVVTSPPTASGFARSDSTATPSQPSTLSFSSSNNQVTTSWTNGSPITSVSFAASGAGVNTSYTDTSAPFITSDLSNYSSSGTYTATVTNFNNSLQVRASWNQSNSQSYQVNYSSSAFGSDQTAIINNSGSSVNHDIGWSSGMGSFTFQSVTLWSGANGTGTSNTFSTGLSAITPTEKSSSRSNSTSLTYILPNLITNPAYGTATRASGGWSATISTAPNPTGGTYSVVSQTAGSASVNSSTGALTASGLTAGQSSTVTIQYNRSGYNPVNITATGQALSNLTTNPAYGTATPTTGGWSATISTNPNPTGGTYSVVTQSAGTPTINSSTGALSVSGLGNGASSTVTVRYSLSGYNSVDITASGTSSTVQYTITWNANGGSGGGSTTQNAGVAHTAPSPGTRSGFTFLYWRDSASGDFLHQVNNGGTFTPTGNITFWARWQSNFVTPSAPAPSLASQRTSSIVRWYCDYPSVSGSVSSITGMQFQIRTTAGGGTLLASGTRSYPGAFTYPYFAAGTNWAFRCGTSDGDISFSSSTRFARARVVMLGTDGNTYNGTYSEWVSA